MHRHICNSSAANVRARQGSKSPNIATVSFVAAGMRPAVTISDGFPPEAPSISEGMLGRVQSEGTIGSFCVTNNHKQLWGFGAHSCILIKSERLQIS